MATGYGEFAKGARQGSMNPQQWNAYLMQQNQIRSAYKQAFSELQAASQQEGLNIAPPELRQGISQAEAQEKLKAYAEQVNQNLSYFDVDVQLNTVYKSAASSGLNVPRPTMYGKTVKDAATAKVIIDNYSKKISQVALQKGLTNAVNDIKAQAAQQGVTLAGLSPNVYAGLTEARAQYFVDQYLKNANNQIAVKNYNEAISSISAQAKAAGVHMTVPTATGINSANAQARIDQYANVVNSALLQKSVSGAIDSIHAQAKGYGVEVSKPSVSGITQANAQAVIDGYLNKVNNVLASQPVVGSTPELKSAPTKITRVGPGGENPLSKPTKIVTPDAKIHGTGYVAPPFSPGQAGVSLPAPEYIVRDDRGREQTISQSQLQQMQKAQANRKSSENFTIIPEEVANSKANWWINSQGLYEWTPVTASDKAHLEKVNKQRAYMKQSPVKTLTLGASPSEAYSKEWYRTGGNNHKAPVGSGNKKIQQMKAVSIARANPDKLYDKYGKEIQRVVYNKDAGTSTGSVKIYASKADLKQARIDAAKALKDAEAIRNAYKPVEALNRKVIDPVQMKSGIAGTGENKVTVQTREIIKNKKGEVTDIKILAASGTAKEYFKASQLAKANGKAALTGFGVSGIVGFNAEGQPVINAEQASFKDVQDFKTVNQIAQDVARTNEDAIRARARAEALKVNPKGSEEYLRGVENVAVRANRSTWENIKAGSNHARTQASKAVSSILPDLDKIAKVRDAHLAGIKVTVTSPKGETRKYTALDTQRGYQKAVKDNVVSAGLLKFTEDEYNYVRNDPLKYAAETGVIMASGAAFGAGAVGLKAVVNPRLAKVAGKAVGKHGVDVALIGVPAVVGGASVYQYFNSEDYNTLSGIEKETAKVQMVAGGFRTLKDFAIAAPGFKAGSKAMEGTISKVKAMRATPSTVKINKPSGLENALPSEFDITNVARNAPKARPRTVTDKVVSLKRQVSKLEAKGKESDKPKIKQLKQQINAIEQQKKNTNALASMKMKNRTDIKEVAEVQAFDSELASLKEMKSFVDSYMQPDQFELRNQLLVPNWKAKAVKPLNKDGKFSKVARNTELIKDTQKYAKKNFNRKVISQKVEKAQKSVLKVTGLESRAIKLTQDKTKGVSLSKLAEESVAEYNSGKTFKPLTSAEEFDVEVSRLMKDPEMVKSLKHLQDLNKFASEYMAEKPYTGMSTASKAAKLSEVQGRRVWLNGMQSKQKPLTKTQRTIENKQARDITRRTILAKRIEKGLEDARIKGDVLAEAKFLSQATKFRIKYGISTEKALSTASNNKPVESLGSRRTEYQKKKELHDREKTRLKKELKDALPYDITNVVKYSKVKYGEPSSVDEVQVASKKLLRDVARWKQTKDLPSDATNLVGYRRAPKVKITLKDIAEYKAQFGDKYHTNELSNWESFKDRAAAYNKELASRRGIKKPVNEVTEEALIEAMKISDSVNKAAGYDVTNIRSAKVPKSVSGKVTVSKKTQRASTESIKLDTKKTVLSKVRSGSKPSNRSGDWEAFKKSTTIYRNKPKIRQARHNHMKTTSKASEESITNALETAEALKQVVKKEGSQFRSFGSIKKDTNVKNEIAKKVKAKETDFDKLVVDSEAAFKDAVVISEDVEGFLLGNRKSSKYQPFGKVNKNKSVKQAIEEKKLEKGVKAELKTEKQPLENSDEAFDLELAKLRRDAAKKPEIGTELPSISDEAINRDMIRLSDKIHTDANKKGGVSAHWGEVKKDVSVRSIMEAKKEINTDSELRKMVENFDDVVKLSLEAKNAAERASGKFKSFGTVKRDANIKKMIAEKKAKIIESEGYKHKSLGKVNKDVTVKDLLDAKKAGKPIEVRGKQTVEDQLSNAEKISKDVEEALKKLRDEDFRQAEINEYKTKSLFDSELANLKERDFDSRLQQLKTNASKNKVVGQEHFKLTEEAEKIDKDIVAMAESINKNALKSERLTKSIKEGARQYKQKNDKFTQAKKKTQQSFGNIRKNYASGSSAETNSGGLKLLQKTETVAKQLEIQKQKRTKVKAKVKVAKAEQKTETVQKTKVISKRVKPERSYFRGMYLPVSTVDGYEYTRYPATTPSTIAGFRSIKQVEQVINSIGTTLKTSPETPVKPKVREITRTYNTTVPSIKPHTITQERVRNDLNVPVVPRTEVKPSTMTPTKVDPVIKNIIKEVTVVTGITKITPGYKVRVPPQQKGVIAAGKKPHKQPVKAKDPKGIARYMRKIQNDFGNLETMFGKATARPIKRTIKKATRKA